MIDCEEFFDHSDAMLAHLKTCPRLLKGVYRCLDTGKEVRIGKCTSKGCHQLQHCKDRIATAVNSLKRRLSPRGSRPRRLIEIAAEKQTMSPEMSVVDQMWDESYPVGVAELAFDVRPPLAELDTDCEVNSSKLYFLSLLNKDVVQLVICAVDYVAVMLARIFIDLTIHRLVGHDLGTRCSRQLQTHVGEPLLCA